jgi:predicted ATPase
MSYWNNSWKRAQRLSFVGRRHEVAETRSLLGSVRLLTLTGVGGVGKTRLALEVATASSHLFTGGVWLVDLAAVRDPSELGRAVGQALGIPDAGVRPVLGQVIGYLAGRRALLVLDNCEHVADACAELAQALLSSGPELHIVATSRRTLGLIGEHILVVPPLGREEAVELLRQRAAAVRPALRLQYAAGQEPVPQQLDGLQAGARPHAL